MGGREQEEGRRGCEKKEKGWKKIGREQEEGRKDRKKKEKG